MKFSSCSWKSYLSTLLMVLITVSDSVADTNPGPPNAEKSTADVDLDIDVGKMTKEESINPILEELTPAARRFLYILNGQLERTTGQSPVGAGPDRGYVANAWFSTKTSDETSALLPAVYPTTTLPLKVKLTTSTSVFSFFSHCS